MDSSVSAGLVPEERALVDYLLGRLPDGQREALERRLFTEDSLHEELLATTDDLIHDYLSGSLSADDRSRFETEFLAVPAHRARLAFVKNMLSALDRVSADEPEESGSAGADRPEAVGSSRSSGWWLLAAGAAIAVLGAAITLAVRSSHRSEPAVAGPVTAPSGSAPSSTQGPPNSVETSPAATAETQEIRLPRPSRTAVDLRLSSRTRLVRLEVEPEQDAPGFNAVIRAASGKTVWHAEGLPPVEHGQRLALAIPARLLASGRYTLRIEGEPLRDSIAPPPSPVEYHLQISRVP